MSACAACHGTSWDHLGRQCRRCNLIPPRTGPDAPTGNHARAIGLLVEAHALMAEMDLHIPGRHPITAADVAQQGTRVAIATIAGHYRRAWHQAATTRPTVVLGHHPTTTITDEETRP